MEQDILINRFFDSETKRAAARLSRLPVTRRLQGARSTMRAWIGWQMPQPTQGASWVVVAGSAKSLRVLIPVGPAKEQDI
ncbi:hypothetical protein [Candidatus Phaeomarinobacter ectocarpi]|uniref:hypothetical protein n=1 Tax=Candidatus Phaeomarinibacter ectocarpi TaxID=1458461 RepID=UPI0005C79C7A|nr:hypothetical protein [Candidatus Phaeomarinobacter ectocarpi]